MKDHFKQNIIVTGILLIFISFLIGLGWYFYRTTNFGLGFSKVKIGDTKAKVLSLMGNESINKPCNSEIRQKYRDKDCFEINGYYSISEYWAIAFDDKGNVVEKYRWTFDDGYGKPNEIDMLF
ncbi:MAG: hypothetical protein K1X72_02155 [Pyrinomonadaceae bacterium]|nr:hypothetical protein [Pyrinomonadaceae bacterium]